MTGTLLGGPFDGEAIPSILVIVTDDGVYAGSEVQAYTLFDDARPELGAHDYNIDGSYIGPSEAS